MDDDEAAALRQHLLARVERTAENTLTEGSKQSYTGSIIRYLSWLYCKGEVRLGKRLLSDEFRDGVLGNTPKADYMRTFLAQKPRVPPLIFSEFSGSDFTLWLASLQDEAEQQTGKPLTHSTMSGHRSALRFLFSENQLNLDDYTDKTYEKFFVGLKRDTADIQGGGVGKVLVGKLPLSFKAYVALAGCLLGSGSAEDAFAHCFMTLQWNLMCRSASTASVCSSHLTWREDAMGVVFPRMKNDQAGERPREPRHVYANPVDPTVCPILSMAVYFMCFPSITGRRIFPGSSQEERFRKRLHNILSRPPLSTLLDELGLSPSDIGTHSIRKGSATYCSSGSTACPSSASVRVRAGWSTGAVHERYCQYESAGDQHVGRTASGLSVDTPDFAALPPRFDPITDTVIEATKGVFPALHRVAPSLASFCLASLVYHDEFLTHTLPAKHPVRQNYYFKNTTLKHTLRALVRCSPGDRETLRATGVPPHVTLLVHMKALGGELRELVAAVRELPEAISARVSAREEEANGPVTRSELRGIMQAIENVNSSLEAMRSQIPHPQPQARLDFQNPDSELQVQSGGPTVVNAEGGRLVRAELAVPLPKTTLMTVWQLWFVGSPPLRLASPFEMRSDDERKRLSDLAFVMRVINDRVPGFPANSRPTLHEANDAFLHAIKNFDLLNKTPKGRARRADQLKWTSVAVILRTHHARNTHE